MDDDEPIVTRVGKFDFFPDDQGEVEISPIEILHDVSEIKSGGQLMECYNYIVYYFDKEGECYKALAYLDTISEVSLFGPYESREAVQQKVKPAAYYDDVLTYLKRRFRHIQAFGEDGYVTVWKDPDYDEIN